MSNTLKRQPFSPHQTITYKGVTYHIPTLAALARAGMIGVEGREALRRWQAGQMAEKPVLKA